MEQLYEKYTNIQIFTRYRNYRLAEDEFLDYEKFRNKIQHTSYVFHKLVHAETAEVVDIYLFERTSKYMKTTAEFTKLMDRYRGPSHIILFTKEKLSTYLAKATRKYPHLKIDNYLHKHFVMELSKGPLCAKHTILSIEEAREVCFDLMTHGHNLPSIAIDDPQNIWIGGQLNDIIKIEANSEITGRTIRYRRVTPVTGRVEQSTGIKKIDIPKVKQPEEMAEVKAAENIDSEADSNIGGNGEYEDYEDYEDDYE